MESGSPPSSVVVRAATRGGPGPGVTGPGQGRVTGTIADVFGEDLKGLNADLNELDNNLSRITSFPDKLLPGDLSPLEQARSNFEKLDQALASMVESGQQEQAAAIFERLAVEAKKGGNSVDQLAGQLDQYRIALENADASPGPFRVIGEGWSVISSAIGAAIPKVDRATAATERNTGSLRDHIKAMREERDQRLAALDAQIGYQQALDDADQSLKDNGKTLDITTEKGRANKTALLGVADGWNNLSNRMQNAPGAFQTAKAEFIDLAERMGASEDEARKLAREILNLPSKRVHIDVETSAAERAVERFQRLMDSVKDKHVKITATGVHVGGDGYSGGTILRASGGYVSGPGSATSDSIPAWLSNGEYVVNAAATARHRHLLEAINANRYAAGGYVGSGGGSSTVYQRFQLSDDDAYRIASILSNMRPLYGDVHVQDMRAVDRHLQQRERMASVGGSAG